MVELGCTGKERRLDHDSFVSGQPSRHVLVRYEGGGIEFGDLLGQLRKKGFPDDEIGSAIERLRK